MGKAFDYNLDFNNTDFRARPGLYRMGKGEQGVLLVQPYKGELLPHWRFRTPEIARASAEKLYQCFLEYRDAGDFVGMDMARKFLQMGYTRSRRYANHASGQKYAGSVPADKKGRSGAHGRPQLPRDPDPVKAESARIFYEVWQRAAADPVYMAAVAAHKARLRES
ncbi:DUF4385 domain-containing protein [Flaviaesturariibacter flavus]|uniref:DUF4385 domain-containing protein n=1 Tax=Flaviaesturariibacter flavus TaxID=2502780 RepID=A0A4R1BBV4_9BACT|nr:DUF4385 domain-containing protein [Flaviaesturariibacter flavus]TCJ14505.1 DUF4385 domain-containing protein [Flaviaesturariibacter flavus]